MTDGYLRMHAVKYNLELPSDIITIIFTFFYIVHFHFEHGKRVQIKGNTITNIDTSQYAVICNTTVIDDWMDPDSDDSHIHTIRVKFIKGQERKASIIAIGIVHDKYYVDRGLFNQKNAYWINSSGQCKGRINGKFNRYRESFTERFGDGDILSLTLDVKALSLSFEIDKGKYMIKNTLFKAGTIIKTKYKWAISVFYKDDACEILDIIHSM